jgi:transcriptional regulator with XRE-family HTH domain
VNNLRNNILLKKFGVHLRQIRQDKKLSLEALAYEADIELSQVYRVEKGLVNPTLSTLNALAKGLEISISELTDFET